MSSKLYLFMDLDFLRCNYIPSATNLGRSCKNIAESFSVSLYRNRIILFAFFHQDNFILCLKPIFSIAVNLLLILFLFAHSIVFTRIVRVAIYIIPWKRIWLFSWNFRQLVWFQILSMYKCIMKRARLYSLMGIFTKFLIFFISLLHHQPRFFIKNWRKCTLLSLCHLSFCFFFLVSDLHFLF